MSTKPYIVGVGGTTRAGSTSERAVSLSLKAAADAGAETLLLSGPSLELPMYAPERKERSPEVTRIIEAFRRCDGVIIASPAYHGSISGLIKNALDYTEDLSGDKRVYFDGCAIGLIVAAAGWQAAGQTLAALRAIAHSLRGWPTPLGVMLNSTTAPFDKEGTCVDLNAKFQLETVGRQVVEFARMQMASRASAAAQ